MLDMKQALILATLALFLAGMAAGQPQGSSSVDPGLMPGNPFYKLEQTVENLEVSLAGAIGGDDMKAKALANNAEERLAEANALAERNRSEEAAEMIESYSRAINKSQGLADRRKNTELSEKIRNISDRNQEVLEEVKNKVPEQARDGIQRAIENSRKMTGSPQAEKLNGTNTPDVPGGKPKNKTGSRPRNSTLPNARGDKEQENLGNKEEEVSEKKNATNETNHLANMSKGKENTGDEKPEENPTQKKGGNNISRPEESQEKMTDEENDLTENQSEIEEKDLPDQ